MIYERAYISHVRSNGGEPDGAVQRESRSTCDNGIGRQAAMPCNHLIFEMGARQEFMQFSRGNDAE